MWKNHGFCRKLIYKCHSVCPHHFVSFSLEGGCTLHFSQQHKASKKRGRLRCSEVPLACWILSQSHIRKNHWNFTRQFGSWNHGLEIFRAPFSSWCFPQTFCFTNFGTSQLSSCLSKFFPLSNFMGTFGSIAHLSDCTCSPYFWLSLSMLMSCSW